MISDSDHMQPEERSRQAPQPGATLRRRRFVGAAGGLGVLLAVQARSALGQGVCQSPSAMLSGNTSPREGQVEPCAGGFSANFWKLPDNSEMWSVAQATFPSFSVPVSSECMIGQSPVTADHMSDPGTLVSTAFPDAPGDYADVSLWQIIAYPDMFEDGPLLATLACAWLNAGAVDGYPIMRRQVQDMQSQLYATGFYCPSGTTCRGGGMSAEEVREYIEGMYEDATTTYSATTLCASGIVEPAETEPTTKGRGKGGKSKKS